MSIKSSPPIRPSSRPPTGPPTGSLGGTRRGLGSFFAAVLIVLLFLLAGSLFWLAQAPAFLSPTPTPTATAGVVPTATPNLRATHVVEDDLTAVAYAQHVTVAATLLPTKQPALPLVTPGQAESPLGTPTNYTVNMPTINNGGSVPNPDPTGAATATAIDIYAPFVGANSPLPTPVPTPLPPDISPLELPTATQIPAPIVLNTETPVPTPTLPPTPIPTPTYTPRPFAVQSLQASVHPATMDLREGPSNLYGKGGSVAANTLLNLNGRDATGEWVYLCCYNNQPRWVRQAYLTLTGNQAQPGLPVGGTPNDVRWLAVQAAPPNMPVRTPIPAEDAPLPHRDLGNSGRVAALPQPVLHAAWDFPVQGSPYAAPPVALGPNVLIVSADNHLYNWNRITGAQQWRYDFGQTSNFPLAVQENTAYIASNQNTAFALQINNNGNELWHQALSAIPDSGFSVVGDKLFYVGKIGAEWRVVALNRSNGASLNDNVFASATPIKPLAVGSQLLYAGGATLAAFDIYNYEKVWTGVSGIINIAAPPVYINDGRLALAELYIVDGTGNLYLLDANTGSLLHNFGSGEGTSNQAVGEALVAVGDTLVYVAGNGYLKAFERTPGTQSVAYRWRSFFSGEVSNLFVDARQVLLVTKGGEILHIDPATGGIIARMSVGGAIAGVAISGPYLFVARTDGNLNAFQGVQ